MPTIETEEQALVYDSEEAVNFVFDRTAYPRSIIEQTLMEQTVYEVLVGVCPPDLMEGLVSDEDLAAKKKRHTDLFPDNSSEHAPFISYDGEAEFICRETGLPADVITNIIREETRYKVKEGIMDAEAVDAYQEWADEWVQSREES